MSAGELFIKSLNFKSINYFPEPAMILKIVTSNSLKMDPDVVAALTLLGM